MLATSADSNEPRIKDTAADAASPASFQPLKAQTSTGCRSFGRSDQITSLIAFTVPDAPRRHAGAAFLSELSVTIRRVATLAGQRTQVAELRAGDEVEGVFACTRKDRLTARSGAPYLAVELRDRTGAIPARAFRDADFLAGQFERGDLVEVSGRVERFRDELQVELRTIRRADPGAADPAEFLPVAYRDLDELDGFLEHLAREVYDPDLRALLDSFLSDEDFRAELRRAPCTRAGHHAYLGGLLEHTDRDGAVTRWSRPAEELFGWPGARMLGRPLVETLGLGIEMPETGGRLHPTA